MKIYICAMDNVEDNIDAYVEKFSSLEKSIDAVRFTVDGILVLSNPNDRKMYEIVKVLSAQQKIIEDMYTLLVEMNNIFGQKDNHVNK